METIDTRYSRLKISYDGKDISADLAPFVTSFSYNDQAHGKADDISVSLADRDGRFHSSWMPEKGAVINASIQCFNWFKAADSWSLPCGTFEIDEVGFHGPPDVVTFQAVSTAVSTSLRREQKTRFWENKTLKDVASSISGQHGLSLFYDGPAVLYERIDQRGKSDLEFLQGEAEKQGFFLKVTAGRMVLVEGKGQDSQSPVLTLTRGTSAVATWDFKTKAEGIYTACQVDYFDPDKKELKHHVFAPGGVATGQTLKINTRVETVGAAERVARARLRRANKGEITGDINLMGDPRVSAGQVVNVSGFGFFDQITFLVHEARHLYEGKYTTSISLKRTLEY